MSGSFELLPSELLESVLDKLPTDAVINLWRTSKYMSNRINNHLFGHTAALNHVKAWACMKGDVDVLRAAIARDGDPNFFWETKRRNFSRSIPRTSADWLSKELEKTSTLRKVIAVKKAKALGALLDMGATFEALDNRGKRLISYCLYASIGKMPADLLEKLAEVKLGSWVLDTHRSLMDLIRAGAPVSILRSVTEGLDLNVGNSPRSFGGDSPLSAAIDIGKGDIVNFLCTMGADMNRAVEIQRIPSTAWYRNEVFRPQPIDYSRPYHVPIFAAARHMAKTGSPEMLDLCLEYGVDINQRSPALQRYKRRYKMRNVYFTTAPLLTYLENIPSFPVHTELDPIAGIDYFISQGANIQRNEAPEQWYLGSTKWLNIPSEVYCQPVSIVELLLSKWYLAKLQEPQFLDTIRYLIAQGSGLDRAENIILDFSHDSVVTRRPLPHSHADHPDNVPMWWGVVHQLWDRLDEIHGHSYAWMQYSLRPGEEAKSLMAAGIETQEQKDRLLYTYFTDQNCLLYPQHYGILPRLVLDRQMALGADINASVGEKGETLLFYVCDQINKAFVTGNTETIDTAYRNTGMAQVFQIKLRELVLSLVNKGADPRKPVDGWTPCHVLERDVNTASLMNGEFLVNLVSEIDVEREEFLRNGSTSSVLVHRADILDLPSVKDNCEYNVYKAGGRDVWLKY